MRDQTGGEAVPTTEAQRRASAKYRAKKYDEIKLLVPKGDREGIRLHAVARAESLNGFVNRAIKETMARDNKSPEE